MNTRSAASLALLLAVSMYLPGQGDVTGRVVGPDGTPVPAAKISFEPFSGQPVPRTGQKGNYGKAQALHSQEARGPRGATDAEGHFRVMLSPAQLALAAGGRHEWLLVVRASGYATWQRCIGSDLRASNGIQVQLSQSGTPLTLRCMGEGAPIQGFAVIERPFRLRGVTSIRLLEHLALDASGSTTFTEPASVPGESPATAPTIRVEGYSGSIYAAGYERWEGQLDAGTHELQLVPDRSARRVVAERGKAAQPPVEASYRIGTFEAKLSFSEPRVPLLGGEMPFRVHSKSGPVLVDSWDPDLPMFVEAVTETAQPASPAVGPHHDLELQIQDRRGNPLAGAGVWIEDSAVQEAASTARCYALSDAEGRAMLTGLPAGTFRVLVVHPTEGERETLVDPGKAAPPAIRLRAAEVTVEPTVQLDGSLRLDLAGFEAPLEIAVLNAGGRLVVKKMPNAPARIRVDGLVPGPATLLVRAANRPVTLLGGVLANPQAPLIDLSKLPSQRLRLQVKDSSGKPPVDLKLRLSHAGDPSSAEAQIALQPQLDGEYLADLALRGSVWLTASTATEQAEFQCSADQLDRAIAAVLRPIPVSQKENSAQSQPQLPGAGR